MTATDRKPDETGRQFTFTKVSRRDAVLQWWHGRRDGRRALPSLAPDAGIGDLAPTPHDKSLIQRRDEVAERELQRWHERSDEMYQKIAETYKQIQRTEHALRERLLELEIAERPPSEEALRRRGPAEEDLAEEVVRRRRSAEFAKGLMPLRKNIEELRGLSDTLHIQRAKYEALITKDLRKAQSRGSQYVSFIGILRARYWRALVRRHPDGERLLPHVPPAAPAPEWIATADYRTVLDVRLPDDDITDGDFPDAAPTPARR